MAQQQQQSSGIVDTAFESAKSGVNVVKTIAEEGIGGGADVLNTTVDLGQEYVRLLSEGGQITVGKLLDLINHSLDRVHHVVSGGGQ